MRSSILRHLVAGTSPVRISTRERAFRVAPPLPEGMAVALSGLPELAELEEKYMLGQRAIELGSEAAAMYERCRELAPDFQVMVVGHVMHWLGTVPGDGLGTPEGGLRFGSAATVPADPDLRLRALTVMLVQADVALWRARWNLPLLP